MIADHFPYAVFALLIEIGIVHAIYSKAPGMIFFPYHNAPFIAHVKEQLIIGIMAGAQRIRSHVLHQIHIPYHQLERDSAS